MRRLQILTYAVCFCLFASLTYAGETKDYIEGSQITDHEARQALIRQLKVIDEQQSKSGAIFPRQCVNKKMKKRGCRKEQSLFVSAFVGDAIREATNYPRLNRAKEKLYAYLNKHFSTARKKGLTYFHKHSLFGAFIKADLDDNSLVPGLLARAGYDVSEEHYQKLIRHGLVTREIKRKNSDEVFKDRFFSTWLKPTKALYWDLDVVVNSNVLWLFGFDPEVQKNYADELAGACRYINQMATWSSESDEWSEFHNDRHWGITYTHRWQEKTGDYSAWYPSQYTFVYALMRAYTDGNQSCIRRAAKLAEKMLLERYVYGRNQLDQGMGTSALLRMIEHKLDHGHDVSEMLVHAEKALSHLAHWKQIGEEPFFYYGAFGYVGSPALIAGFKIEAFDRYLKILNRVHPKEPIHLDEIENQVQRGLDYLRREQHEDGSWTALTQVSSIRYNMMTIFLYEALEMKKERAEEIRGLMNYVWADQNPETGGFAGYPGGKDNIDIGVQAYLAALMTGEDQDSPRMLALEQSIRRGGGIEKVHAPARPFLWLFDILPTGQCAPATLLKPLLSMDSKLPWVRVMLYPLYYLLSTKQFYPRPRLRKKMARLGSVRPNVCILAPHPFKKNKRMKRKFFKWLLDHRSPDGTLFDYTPTTIPAILALSTEGDKYKKEIDESLRAIKRFQMPTPKGIFQSSNEASIGETYVTINALLDLDVKLTDPLLSKSERFLYRVRQKGTGAFGFSKHNTHFADSDDTSNAIYVLKRIDVERRGIHDADEKFENGLDWMIGLQNRDGGFGTWEREAIPILRKLFHSALKGPNLVLSESVAEHTARIVLNLALFKDKKRRWAKAYKKALKWLRKKQRKDGSFQGTWFVDYLFGTSMVLSAFGTAQDQEALIAPTENALAFILSHQQPDGGFSETPESFIQKRPIAAAKSSPSQTGLIVTQLLIFLREEGYQHWDMMKPHIEAAVRFLAETQKADGTWADRTWTGVTFPEIEYLIYPYIQQVEPIHAMGMYRRMRLKLEGQ